MEYAQTEAGAATPSTGLSAFDGAPASAEPTTPSDDPRGTQGGQMPSGTGTSATSARIAAALSALRDDRTRRSGKLEWSDFYRVVTRRRFTQAEVEELSRKLVSAGIAPVDSRQRKQSTRQRPAHYVHRRHVDVEKLVLADACSTSLLPDDEVLALARRIRYGDAGAREILIESNMRLVVWVARSFYGGGSYTLIDLVQEGMIGLLRAVERFDPARGYKFSTYAVWWIRQAIGRAVANHGRLIRVPAYLATQVNHIRHARRRLAQRLSREPTYDELAAETGLERGQIALLDDVLRSPLSIEAQREDEPRFDLPDREDRDSGDVATMEDLDHSELVDLLRKALARLRGRERDVLRMRFGLDGHQEMTLQAIADVIGVTRERVRQIEGRALERLAIPHNAAGLRRAVTSE